MVLRRLFARLGPRRQALLWAACAGAAFTGAFAAWVAAWRLTLPLELCFAAYMCARMKHLERQAPRRLFERISRQQRMASLQRVLDAVAVAHVHSDDASEPLARFLSAWHGHAHAPLRRGNLRRFLSANCFFTQLEDLDGQQRCELEEMMQAVTANFTVPPGEDPELRHMEVSTAATKLQWLPFPLAIYTSLAAVHVVSDAFMWCAGFTHQRDGVLDVWHKPPTSSSGASQPPVVLLPGIGVGVGGYLPLLLHMLHASGADANASVFAVQLPHITVGHLGDRRMPDERTVVASIAAMLARHQRGGASGARFIAHSYGSFVLAWMLHDATARQLVRSALLLDPVALLISFPHTTHGAVYRGLFEQPMTVALSGLQPPPPTILVQLRAMLQLLITHAFTREAHVALALQKNVHWPTYSLWLDDFPPGCSVTVALSTDDALVPSAEVARYSAAAAARRRGDISVSVLWLKQHAHGEVALNQSSWQALAQCLRAVPLTTDMT